MRHDNSIDRCMQCMLQGQRFVRSMCEQQLDYNVHVCCLGSARKLMAESSKDALEGKDKASAGGYT